MGKSRLATSVPRKDAVLWFGRLEDTVIRRRVSQWVLGITLMAGLAGCGAPVSQSVPPRWIGAGGWSLNAVVGAGPPIPLQYSVFGVNEPPLTISSVGLQGTLSSTQLNGYSIVRHRWSAAVQEYRIAGLLMLNHTEHATLQLQIRSSRWTQRVMWGSVAARLVDPAVSWLTPIKGIAGTQGSFTMPELYAEELRNPGPSSIKVLGIVQAGAYRILATGAQLTTTLPPGPDMPKHTLALKGLVIPPQQTVVVEIEFLVPRHQAVNVIFVPGLRIERDRTIGVQPLATSQWLTDFVPRPTSVIRWPNTVIQRQ